MFKNLKHVAAHIGTYRMNELRAADKCASQRIYQCKSNHSAQRLCE